jgi:hypothetical protein
VVVIGGVFDYRLLAINASPSISISITYIVFLTKMQKRQILLNGFAFFENYIKNILYP